MDKEWVKKIELMLNTIDVLCEMDNIPIEHRESLLNSIKFRRELSKESDRGCALLAAAHIDSLLERLLKKVLVGNNNHFKLLFSSNGPLGTFSGKVSLSYSLGLISFDAMNDIHTIRRIRNEFGHSPHIISFLDEKIKTQCDKLKYNVLDDPKSAQSKFINTVSGIAGFIEIEIIEKSQFKEAIGLDLQKRKKDFDDFISEVEKKAKELAKKQV